MTTTQVYGNNTEFWESSPIQLDEDKDTDGVPTELPDGVPDDLRVPPRPYDGTEGIKGEPTRLIFANETSKSSFDITFLLESQFGGNIKVQEIGSINEITEAVRSATDRVVAVIIYTTKESLDQKLDTLKQIFSDTRTHIGKLFIVLENEEQQSVDHYNIPGKFEGGSPIALGDKPLFPAHRIWVQSPYTPKPVQQIDKTQD